MATRWTKGGKMMAKVEELTAPTRLMKRPILGMRAASMTVGLGGEV